jgi:hypothetical protein
MYPQGYLHRGSFVPLRAASRAPRRLLPLFLLRVDHHQPQLSSSRPVCRVLSCLSRLSHFCKSKPSHGEAIRLVDHHLLAGGPPAPGKQAPLARVALGGLYSSWRVGRRAGCVFSSPSRAAVGSRGARVALQAMPGRSAHSLLLVGREAAPRAERVYGWVLTARGKSLKLTLRLPYFPSLFGRAPAAPPPPPSRKRKK